MTTRSRSARAIEQHLDATRGMHGQQVGPQLRRLGSGAAHSVRDIVQLEVEEHAPAAPGQSAHGFRARGGEQLLTS